MTENEELLLSELSGRILSEKNFIRNFPHDVVHDSSYIVDQISEAIKSDNSYRLDLLMQLIWLCQDKSSLTPILNELLIYPHHYRHQEIARLLQKNKNPSTIPYVRKALDSGFNYLAYTGSNDRSIAKWFSWLLSDIGTSEAISVIKEYSRSQNEEIRQEMNYRLSKINEIPKDGG
jgi:hypothetical protein